MGVLHAYQADVFGDLNEDGGIGPDAVAELHWIEVLMPMAPDL